MTILSIIKTVLLAGGPERMISTALMRRTGISQVLSMVFRYIPQPPSATRLLKQLRKAGLGIKSSDYYHLYRMAAEYGPTIARQGGLAPNKRIPESYMTVARYGPTGGVMNLKANYLYRVTAVAGKYDVPGAPAKRRSFSLVTDVRLSKDEALEEFREQFGETMEQIGVDWETLRFEAAFKRSKRFY